jgi:TetR/AcrR family transcriptional regulator, tetracycline repressor protein
MHLQKEKIIKRAIEVLDRDGLDGVTLRRLAKELDAQAASIYYHIPHKEALLGAMANAILEEYFGDFDFADDKKDWATWLDTLGHALRTAMLAHREAGRVVAGAHLGDVLTKLHDLTIRILHNAGFSYSKA